MIVNSVTLLSQVDLISVCLPSDFANLSFKSVISFVKVRIWFSYVSFNLIISFLASLFSLFNSPILIFNWSYSFLLNVFVFCKFIISIL